MYLVYLRNNHCYVISVFYPRALGFFGFMSILLELHGAKIYNNLEFIISFKFFQVLLVNGLDPAAPLPHNSLRVISTHW